MHRLVTHSKLDRAGVEAVLRPRQQPVLEARAGAAEFDALEGPVWSYRRRVAVEPVEGDDDRGNVTETIEFELAVPYFAWLMRKPFELAVRRPDSARSWWMPPARLDARASAMLGTLAGVAMVFGYLNTLFTQTIAFAGEEFGAGNGAQGFAGSVVRLGGLIALGVLALADRRGRRTVLLGAVVGGCILAATGAFAPSLPWLAGSQVLARGCAVAVLVVVSILTVEEMPAGGRAWAISLLAMAAGFGAGVCVACLRLADIGEQGWRLLYLLPLLALPLVRSIGRRLPESRRFERPHVVAQVRGHGPRLWLLAVAGFLSNVFVAPNAQFNNRFLRDERNYSGGAIALLSLGAGTPGVIGIVAGGRLADVRGRRIVAAVSLTLGSVCNVAFYFAGGWGLWLWAVLGAIIVDAQIPALAVYGPELFPTSLRGRANGIITVASLAGSAVGLAAAGALADHFGRIGPALALLSLGPFLLAVLVVFAFPETARRELEEINPEDRGDE
jgi:MFS family permease